MNTNNKDHVVTRTLYCAWLAIMLAFANPARAHHSVPVNFDMNSDIELSGKIVATKWINPHSQLMLEVTNEAGEKENWLVEMNALNTIRRLGKKFGWSTEDFVVGEMITVGGWPGRHDRSIYFRRAMLASGKKIIWESRLDPNLQRLE